MKNQYREKETKAQEGTQERIYEYEQKMLKDSIKNMQKKTDTETTVYAHLRQFLVEKEEQIRQKSDDWDKLLNTKRQ